MPAVKNVKANEEIIRTDRIHTENLSLKIQLASELSTIGLSPEAIERVLHLKKDKKEMIINHTGQIKQKKEGKCAWK